MKIAYRKQGWKATDIRFVEDDHVPADGEFVIEGDELPSSEELSDPVPISETAQSAILGIESGNPITHRALREFFIGFGTVNPAFQQTLLYQRCKAVDDAIKAERAKL